MRSRLVYVKFLSVSCLLAVGIIIYSGYINVGYKENERPREEEIYKNPAVEETDSAMKATNYTTVAFNETEGVVQEVKYEHLAVKETEFDNDNACDIILNAYKHSGSTATGHILGNRFDTFYVHEPLWQVATRSFYKGPNLFCKDFPVEGCLCTEGVCPNTTQTMGDDQTSTVSDRKGYFRTLEDSTYFLKSILDCSFHQYSDFFFDKNIYTSSKGTLHSIFYKGFGWNQFNKCRSRKGSNFTDCLKQAEKSCKSAKHRVIKLLRMTLDNLTPMLQTYKRLKVIQLFRDPRGILNSQMKSSSNHEYDKNFQRIHIFVTTMCDRIWTDLQASKMLQAVYPDRVKVIQYEHFYNAPLKDAAKDLYEFAGMPFTKEQQSIFQPKSGKQGNSAAGFHPFNYRTKLPWNVVDLFNTECAEVLDGLGYIKYKDEHHLRDLKQSGFANSS